MGPQRARDFNHTAVSAHELAVASRSYESPNRDARSLAIEATAVVLRVLRQRIQGALPQSAYSALAASVALAAFKGNRTNLLRACGCSERTLSRRLAEVGLPSAAALIGWGKVLVASQMMRAHSVTIECAALSLDLSGSAELVHLFRRYAGPTPGEIREGGGLPFALGLLMLRLHESALFLDGRGSVGPFSQCSR